MRSGRRMGSLPGGSARKMQARDKRGIRERLAGLLIQHAKLSGEHAMRNKITVDEAKHSLEAGEDIVFVDARSPKAWDSSDANLPGALRIPPGEVEQHLGE